METAKHTQSEQKNELKRLLEESSNGLILNCQCSLIPPTKQYERNND